MTSSRSTIAPLEPADPPPKINLSMTWCSQMQGPSKTAQEDSVPAARTKTSCAKILRQCQTCPRVQFCCSQAILQNSTNNTCTAELPGAKSSITFEVRPQARMRRMREVSMSFRLDSLHSLTIEPGVPCMRPTCSTGPCRN